MVPLFLFLDILMKGVFQKSQTGVHVYLKEISRSPDISDTISFNSYEAPCPEILQQIWYHLVLIFQDDTNLIPKIGIYQ